MPFFSTLLTLLLPFGEPVAMPGAEEDVVRQAQMDKRVERKATVSSPDFPIWTGFQDASQVPTARQVRIQQRVILRVSPQPGRAQRSFTSELPQRGIPVRLAERPMGNCIATNGIVGVSDRGSRLIMYMRDRSMISAALEKACSPRDFYLGFYLERNDDGQLCVGRDKLISRAGSKCEVTRMRRLEYVAADE